VRVHFQVSGGIGSFPGLAARRTIDLDTLAEEDRRRLQQLVDDARFFKLPSRIPAPRGAADYLTYEITIEDGARRHVVAVSDPVAPGPLQRLIEALRTL
jgi:hypothetical protein